MKKIIAFEYEITKQIENTMNYFSYLNALVNDDDFNSLLRYNDKDDKSLSYLFVNNYNFHLEKYQEIKENFDIN